MHLNNKNKNRPIAAIAATISALALAIILASTSIATPAAAQQTTTALEGNTTTTSQAPSSSGIKLSPQPIYEERSPPGSLIPINQTHGILTSTGTGTITLPNSTQTINTTHNATGIVSFTTFSGYGKETIRAENGEAVTATVYEIVQFANPTAAPQGGGKGIVTAVFQTNSPGTLAPLNGMIAAGIDDMSPSIDRITLWRWESGISSNSTGISSAATPSSPAVQEAPPSANNSSTNTNALTTANEGSPSSSSPPTPSSSTSLTGP